MKGSGPAGELVFADVRARLAKVAGHLGDHAARVAELAATEVAERDRSGAQGDGRGE